jgi:quinohemoprotein ethanol dehydrogenase
VSTAGNLVFQSINDGRLLAYSADKGEQLLEIQTGRGGVGPPITYSVQGKQYVALMAGTGRQATIVGPNDAKVDNPPLLLVFEIDGKAALPKPVPAAPVAGPPIVAPASH